MFFFFCVNSSTKKRGNERALARKREGRGNRLMVFGLRDLRAEAATECEDAKPANNNLQTCTTSSMKTEETAKRRCV